MYITYDLKDGVEYAKLCTSKRKGKITSKEYINLGRVLDKGKGIYRSRERGVFTYNISTNSYGIPPSSFVPQEIAGSKERLLLDFGDSFFLDSFIKDKGLRPMLDALGYGNPDTLSAMLCYYILCSSANCHANDWWDGNFVRILYPKANLTSQRLSDFLSAIGTEHAQRRFFQVYFKRLGKDVKDGANILIDSTGLPNNIRFPLTAISNHNGDISNEVRLIYVTQQETGLPIYLRYCPGNVIDVMTLVRTIKELNAYNINTKFAILDAGYYDDYNITSLYENGVSFVTRLR